MPVLQERGRFWWHEDPIPDGYFAPHSAVTGLLTVDPGRIALELDDLLLNDDAVGETMRDKLIQGVLSLTGKRVLLAGLFIDGQQFRSNGPSNQNFVALDCLLGDEPFRAGKPPMIVSMTVDLKGLEGWLRLGSVKVKKSSNTLRVKYNRPRKATYKLDNERLVIEFGIDGSYQLLATRAVSFHERALLVHLSRQPKQFEEQKEIFELLGDLFILLTGSEFTLDWPKLKLKEGHTYTWYFLRGGAETSTQINWHECWTNFPQLKNDFGSIWMKWRELREHSGPGVYLYLGTKRGMSLYSEHRFVNLIWGIEAFHRKRNSSEPPISFTDKVARIISQIGNEEDAKWLAGKLKRAHEPSLADRIAAVLKGLPIGFKSKAINKFATKCADLRNDISHFGGNREGGSYIDFVGNLEQYGRSLATLYQYLLLYEVGVDPKILNGWINEGFRSYFIKKGFVDVGLMEENELHRGRNQRRPRNLRPNRHGCPPCGDDRCSWHSPLRLIRRGRASHPKKYAKRNRWDSETHIL